MPTHLHADPVAPGQSRTVSEALAYGKQQWSLAWRMWSRQWSQPQLMALAEAVLGEKCIHSSQIKGFATGSLRDPSPKLLRAIAEVNLALAAANGVKIRGARKVPATKGFLWQDKHWLKDAEGQPLDLCGVYLAVIGELDLGMNTKQEIPEESQEAVSRALGAYLRMELAKQGCDFISEMPQLKSRVACLERLLMGKTVSGVVIARDLQKIAEAAQVSDTELWQAVIAPAIAE